MHRLVRVLTQLAPQVLHGDANPARAQTRFRSRMCLGTLPTLTGGTRRGSYPVGVER